MGQLQKVEGRGWVRLARLSGIGLAWLTACGEPEYRDTSFHSGHPAATKVGELGVAQRNQLCTDLAFYRETNADHSHLGCLLGGLEDMQPSIPPQTPCQRYYTECMAQVNAGYLRPMVLTDASFCKLEPTCGATMQELEACATADLRWWNKLTCETYDAALAPEECVTVARKCPRFAL